MGAVTSGGVVSIPAALPFQVKFNSGIPSGRKVDFTLRLAGQIRHTSSEVTFSLTVGTLPSSSVADQNAGNFIFTLSNFGQYGLGNLSFNPLGGNGFVYPRDGKDNLYEGAFLIGTGPAQVSDGARGEDGKTPQQDFEALPGGELNIQTPGTLCDQEGYCKFSDQNAENPLNLEIAQRSLAYTDQKNDDYVIMQYVVKNTNPHPVNNIYAGLFFDWDISLGSADDDQIGMDSILGIFYQFDPQTQIYLSLYPLNHDNFYSYQLDNSLWLYDGFSKPEKYQFLSGQMSKSVSQTLSVSEGKDWSQLVSIGPFDLAPQESVVVAFAIVGGTGLDELETNLSSARAKYESLCTGIDDDNDTRDLPSRFYLSQNYPNPFNPVTTIAFEIKPENPATSLSAPLEKPSESYQTQTGQISAVPTSLKIYNIRGQLVKTLVESNLPAGKYELSWDGTGQNGEKVASGVYLYNLQTPQSQTSRKMILLK